MSSLSTKDSVPTTSTDDLDGISIPSPTKTVEITHHAPQLVRWLQELVWRAYHVGEGEMGTFEGDQDETWVFHFAKDDLIEKGVQPSLFQRDVEEIWIFCKFDDVEDVLWDGKGY